MNISVTDFRNFKGLLIPFFSKKIGLRELKKIPFCQCFKKYYISKFVNILSVFAFFVNYYMKNFTIYAN